MEAMSGAMGGLKDSESFKQILVMFENPILGILTGTLLTAIIQSSSASVGILQALAITGTIPYSMAIPIILGQNIGTTITPVISSISGNANSKRVALACVYIKMIGVIIVSVAFYILNGIFDFAIMHENVSVLSIAVIHTLFNIISTVILMPFCKQIEYISYKSIPDDKQETNDEFAMLDDRFLNMPSFAVEKSRALVYEMVTKTKDALISAIGLLENYDKNIADDIERCESEIDKYEDKISAYLVKIAGRELSAADSLEVSRLLHSLGDIERISDHSVNIMKAAKEIEEKNIAFSESAMKDLRVMSGAVEEVLNITAESLVSSNPEEANKVEPLVKLISKLKHKIKKNHINRLREGKCTVELGFILSDLLTVYDRVAGHCSNIAVCLVEPDNELLESHEYINQMKSEEESGFFAQYEEYKKKYSLEK
ncbi:MAG: Na/Pi symporter, partial [Clostridia bacterium]|nr:Na/Pi symporter [Clostridia bacterium]